MLPPELPLDGQVRPHHLLGGSSELTLPQPAPSSSPSAHVDRSLSNEEVNAIQAEVVETVVKQMGVEVR